MVLKEKFICKMFEISLYWIDFKSWNQWKLNFFFNNENAVLHHRFNNYENNYLCIQSTKKTWIGIRAKKCIGNLNMQYQVALILNWINPEFTEK
jgi:hypothetical protein